MSANDRSTLLPLQVQLGQEDHSRNLIAFLVHDLLTSKTVGSFARNAPLWRPVRLSPTGVYLVGPDKTNDMAATRRDRRLLVWAKLTESGR
ncbi:MAG: hypothetical protein L0211_12825 [Planctomycetaceae bacterium]|nr:hypothetical protein [Planctomycetaceae bacterium]